MVKKGVLILLLVGLFVLVGCEEGSPFDLDAYIFQNNHWGEHIGGGFIIGFVGFDSDDPLMDVVTSESPRVAYTIDVTSFSNGVITATYHKEGEELVTNNITITLSYDAPEMTFVFSGGGELNGQTFILEPTPDTE